MQSHSEVLRVRTGGELGLRGTVQPVTSLFVGSDFPVVP